MRLAVSSTFDRWAFVLFIIGMGCIVASGYFQGDLPLTGLGIGAALVVVGAYWGYRLTRLKEFIDLTPEGFRIRADGSDFSVAWDSMEHIGTTLAGRSFEMYLAIKWRTEEGVRERLVGLNWSSCMQAESVLRRYHKHPELRGKLTKR